MLLYATKNSLVMSGASPYELEDVQVNQKIPVLFP